MKNNNWGGPVKFIDTSRATPYIVLKQEEKFAIIKELNKKINENDLLKLFEFLKDREIVDIKFD
jgi:hypothetical protein